MFEQRLRILLVLFGVGLLVLVGRLVQLQVVQGAYFRERAEATLLTEPESLPFVRGRILDRAGEPLVFDAPSWDVTLDYSVLALEAHHLKGHVRNWLRKKRYAGAATYADVERAFLDEVEHTWADLETYAQQTTPLHTVDLRADARDIHERVRNVREVVARSRGFETDVAEERADHPIIRGLNQQQQIEARERFAAYPWVHVRPSSRRTFADGGEPFAHVLGRLGRVDRADVQDDPHIADPLARYRADELKGKAGVELAAEATLRGRRGRLRLDRQGGRIEEDCAEAVNGTDVTLTLSAALQRKLFALIEGELRGHEELPGGAIVVLDVASREVIALVSYPSYDPSRFSEMYEALRDDTIGLPLRFRAVQSREPPGSIVKPLVCLGGLMNGTISLETREHCNGYLSDDVRDSFRCWELHGTTQRMQHGDVDVVAALRGSCNIFMYRLGERMGVDALTGVFDMAGFGRLSGTGLIEESEGINPTSAYLADVLNSPVTKAHPRYFAIGQGELAVTPIQAANLVATYASGRYRPVTLIRGAAATPEWILPATAAQWAAVRQGMYDVVNDPEGTAYKYAHFEHERYALCGKTGSATVYARPTSYRVPFEEGGKAGIAVVPESAREPAIQRFIDEHPDATFDRYRVQAQSWCPPMGGEAERNATKLAHAWFAGYLQPIGPDGRPQWATAPRIAFAVFIEYGGSGGRTAGPIAKEVATTILEREYANY